MKYYYEYEVPERDSDMEEAGFGELEAENARDAVEKIKKMIPDYAIILYVSNENGQKVFDRADLIAPVL